MRLVLKNRYALFLLLFFFLLSTDINADSPMQNSSDKFHMVVTKSVGDLPSDFLDATPWPRIFCGGNAQQNKDGILLTGIQATPTAYDDWRPSPTMRLKSLEKDSGPNRFGRLNVEGLFDNQKKKRVYYEKTN